MSTEITILAVTAITASLLYISKHLTTSECWSKDQCCKIKLRSDSSSNIATPSPMEYRDTHAHTKFKPTVVETVVEDEPKPAIVSSVV